MPGVTRAANAGTMNPPTFTWRSIAVRASAERSSPSATRSSSATTMPQLARWAAMPEPIVPAPITTARLTGVNPSVIGMRGWRSAMVMGVLPGARL